MHVFLCFGNVLLRCGLAHRFNLYAFWYGNWRLDGLQALLKTSCHFQDTSNQNCGFRVDATLAIPATFRFAQGTMSVKSHLKHTLHDTSFEASLERFCEYMVAGMVCAVAGHPTTKTVLRSASISKRQWHPCKLQQKRSVKK